MSDRDVLERAFAEFGQDQSAWIRRPGIDAARHRARLRRRNHLAVAAAVLALALPLVAVNAARVHGPTPATTSPAVTRPAVTPNPPVITTTAKPGPGVLRDATVELDWSWAQHCGSGATTFRDGAATSQGAGVRVLSVSSTDVDGDGRAEAVARILCDVGDAGPVQVVALQPTAPGTYRVLGTVLRTSPAVAGQVGVRTVSTGDNGQVNIEVVDWAPCCYRPEETTNRQWRTFAWTGTAFEQVSGQRTFDPPAGSRVSVRVSDVAMGPADFQGARRVTGNVTIVNGGPSALTIVTAVFWAYTGTEALYECDRRVCRLDGLPVGTSTERSFLIEVYGPYESGTTVTLGEVAIFADLRTYAREPIIATVP